MENGCYSDVANYTSHICQWPVRHRLVFHTCLTLAFHTPVSLRDSRGQVSLGSLVADVFSGTGGFSEGFRQAGYEIVAGTDIDPDACATFTLNFPTSRLICGDIREWQSAKTSSQPPRVFAPNAPHVFAAAFIGSKYPVSFPT
jgi:hypothetical protein